ncbi:MAG: hypothetical protein H6682_10665 [Candidatus Eisenbacteria bacterium]|nr:hypothetical protein [Candidatus Eisenbacteria bacterium]
MYHSRKLAPPWQRTATWTILTGTFLASLAALTTSTTTASAEEKKKPDPIGVESAAQDEVPGLFPGGPAVEEFRTDNGWSPVGGYRVLVDDVVDERAGLYEDSEHHQFLVLLSGKTPAFVLEKKGRQVGALARSHVERDEEGLPFPEMTSVESIGSFVDDEGFVRFDYDGATYLLRPEPAVVGERSAQALLSERPEYAHLASTYDPSPIALESLSRHHSDAEVIVLFPSWAKVSERIVPPLAKIVEKANNPHLHLTFIGLDRGLAQPESALKAYAPKVVPAVIVRADGRELARFEGTPERRLEIELAEVLKRHPEGERHR